MFEKEAEENEIVEEKIAVEDLKTVNDLCARLRHIVMCYPDVDLTKCTIIGGTLPYSHISDVPYLPCETLCEYHLANCTNFKACRDFQDGFNQGVEE